MWLQLRDQVVARVAAVDDEVLMEDLFATLPTAAAGGAQEKLKLFVDPDCTMQVLRKQRPLRVHRHLLHYSSPLATAAHPDAVPVLRLYLGK